MKKNPFRFVCHNKLRAFSLAYAVVILVVTAIAIAGMTPIFTRKLAGGGLTPRLIGGWYEAYNALPKGKPYCAKCKAKDEGVAYTGAEYVPAPSDGDPSLNPYAKDPKDLIPFERYCRSNGECGYPKERWTEEEKNSPNPPNISQPHKCKNGKFSHFYFLLKIL